MQLTTIASLVSLAASVWSSWGLAGRRRMAWRVAATGSVTAVMLWVEPVQQTLTFGQVNLILMAMVLGDLSLPDRSRGKGIATGLAAGFKLTPAVFLVYLAFTRRTRAAVNGVVTFAATVVLGLLVSPSAAVHYWKGAWLVGDKVGRDYVGNQSVDAVLRRLVGHELGFPSVVLAFGVGVAGLALAVWAYRHGNELAGVVLIGMTGLLVSPISWTHHWVWVVPAVVLGCDLAMRRRSVLFGLAVVGVTLLFLAWPAQIDGVGRHDPTADDLPTGLIWQVPHRDGREHDWSGTDLIVGNLYVVLGLAGLTAAAGAALASSRNVVPSEDAVDVSV
jgi:alpha-1,2-mannosyltransferase